MRLHHMLLSLILIASAARASAADGATDFIISPTAGFTITAPGSYRLAADVTMTTPDVSAVTVNISNVTIDLNGHTIDGGGLGSGNASGIDSNLGNITVRNGRIHRFRRAGVDIGGSNSAANDLNVSGCPTGILLSGNGAKVTDCQVGSTTVTTAVPFTGIWVNSKAVVRDCVVQGNVAQQGNCIGILGGIYCIIERNNCTDNDSSAGGVGRGIWTDYGGTIRGNTCNGNSGPSGGWGIFAGGYALIEGNSCDANSASGAASAHGIADAGYSKIINNICTDNDSTGTGLSYGILVDNDSVVDGNHCASQDGGTFGYGIRVTSARNMIRNNTTTGSKTCGILIDNTPNRCETNRTSEATAILSAGGTSLGTGDLANINF